MDTFFVFVLICFINGLHGSATQANSRRTIIANYTSKNSHCQYLGVTSKQQGFTTESHTPIRLVNGPTRYSGRIEVYYGGVWGTVCDDSFDEDDARVVCRMLGLYNGYSRARGNAYFGTGNGCIALDDLRCNGYEHDIGQCRSNGWFNNNCGHGEDAGVDCYGRTTTKLMSKTYPSTTHFSTKLPWLTTPSHSFRTTYAITRSPYSASHCQYLQTSTDWSYNHITRVLAQTPIRLVNGPTRYSGRVEVYHGGVWGTVCDDSFDDFDAKVVCGMLGFSTTYAKAWTNAHYGSGSGCITIDNLECSGNENDIGQCRSNGWFNHNCGHQEDAGVDCYDSTTLMYTKLRMTTIPHLTLGRTTAKLMSKTYPSTTHFSTKLPWLTTPSHSFRTTYASTPIRLRNGPTRYSGRVEVYHNGQWGTVCDSYFDKFDARVICRMLGLYRGDSYSKAYHNAYFGAGQGMIWLGSLGCVGYENDLTQCRFYGWGGNGYCGHSRDAGVDCNASPYGDVTLPWHFQFTFDVDTTTSTPLEITTQKALRLEDSVKVSCNVNGWDIKVDMGILKQVYPGSKPTDIYLGENTCNGLYSWNVLTFNQGLRECLTSETIQGNALIYNNELVYAEHDPIHPFIIRHYNWTIKVECDVQRNESSAGHLHHDASNSNAHQVSGNSHYPVNMTFFTDPNFLHQIQGHPLQVSVGSDVYVKVFTETSDWSVKMRVHTCYTKPTPNAQEHMRYYIIKNGCEMDKNTHIISQSSHETRFIFQDFEYTSNHEGIYVYCDAIFCSSSDYSNQCLQTCHPVVKRSATN
ncbi:deleted in malignant brain tumors 1 protein-like isoform X2 [Ruditapes philippinarum]|uniref:deleted in malignant brain tumors 1 protein-like isoform X2 n=1 Tax=Ruditapes philippinarum TaxID=129788 RepID=UPI00295AEBC2|nr:deleted in malignant brain tumors 1 protein-like isoform X2 [Ruditapes philippinarum]